VILKQNTQVDGKVQADGKRYAIRIMFRQQEKEANDEKKNTPKGDA